MTKISIAMATYYGARSNREQLDVRARENLFLKLVVTDNGSTDKTPTIIEVRIDKRGQALQPGPRRLGAKIAFFAFAPSDSWHQVSRLQ